MKYMSLSPLDGRYSEDVRDLREYFSEYALFKYRFQIEVEWLIHLAERREVTHLEPLSPARVTNIRSWAHGFSLQDVRKIREIEKTTNHDVKAVEYYLKMRLRKEGLAFIQESVHFCCTSEDINNLAYALMLKEGMRGVWIPKAGELVDLTTELANATSDLPMLSHTHGQTASPTTFGKELAVYASRWNRQLEHLKLAQYLGKWNGAVGNYNAHKIAYPNANWEEISRTFVERFGLDFNPTTTQIEPHDYISEVFHMISRFNSITLDFVRDIWFYVSLGYLRQNVNEKQVGSSTMPHKINPIKFENAEANVGISNALLNHLAQKLPISRLQRDLSDSSALRNVGTAIGHSLLALNYTCKGLMDIQVDRNAIHQGLTQSWEVVSEAIQTVMRKSGYSNSYETMKGLTRGKKVTRQLLHDCIDSLDLPESDRIRLIRLSPDTYTGLASCLARKTNWPTQQRDHD